MKPDILIYQDYVHNNGVLYRSLCSYYGMPRVSFCDAQDILNGILSSSVRLFIMPGGADLYYCEKLNGNGNRLIRKYVESGGNYFGICAGAYYACRALEWGKGTHQEITGPRELAFIDCLAAGPVYPFICKGNIDNSWKSAALIKKEDDIFSVYYNGGPVFVNLSDTQTEIIARYEDIEGKPAAAIAQEVGNGYVLLSSFHIEYSSADVKETLYRLYNPFYEDELLLIKQLEKYEQIRRCTFDSFLKCFERL